MLHVAFCTQQQTAAATESSLQVLVVSSEAVAGAAAINKDSKSRVRTHNRAVL